MTKNGVVLVCVTPQQSGRHLIACGRRFADERGCTLRIMSVLPQRQSFAPDLSVLEALNDAARESGAEMTVCFSDSPADKVREIVRETDAQMLIAGFSGKHSTHFLQSLHKQAPDVPIWLVDSDGSAYTIGRSFRKDAQTEGTFQIVLQAKPTL